MRVNVISDLHLEFGDLELPGGDVLVLSGDACESRTLTKYKYDPLNILGDNGIAGKRLDRAARFFNEEVTKYRKCIYVMGNHEHYHGKFWKTYNELQADMPPNVHLLENEVVEIDGVMFMGASLWTNCNRGDPLTMNHLKFGMNDYRTITWLDAPRGVYRKLNPADTGEIFSKTVQYFRFMLSEHRNKPFVVCTHHAPSFQSVHAHYRHDTLMNGGYASELSDFILDNENIKFWTHGHMHDPNDYMIGQCRVISNPRGYRGHEHQANVFDPTVGFDI